MVCVHKRFNDLTPAAFGDQGVAIGQSPGGTDKRAVKPVAVRGVNQPCLLGGKLPDNFQCNRVKFQNPGIIAQHIFCAVKASRMTGAKDFPTLGLLLVQKPLRV
jgi:hypothetical protein